MLDNQHWKAFVGLLCLLKYFTLDFFEYVFFLFRNKNEWVEVNNFALLPMFFCFHAAHKLSEWVQGLNYKIIFCI